MKGIGDFMKQAEAMQEQMKEMQEKIAALQVTGESGAGLAKVSMNGKHEVNRVELDSSLMAEDKEVVEDLIAAAFNDALRKAEEAQQNSMSGLASGLGFPLDKLPF